METADWLALGAIVLSCYTFVDGRLIEKRLARKADARSTFDGLVTTPVEAKLSTLEDAVREVASDGADAADQAARLVEVTRWVRRTYSPWFVSFEAFLQANTEAKLSELSDLLFQFHDEVAPLFDALGNATSERDIDEAGNGAISASTRFVARIRAEIQQMRLQY
jgi:hypothetical protein